MDVLFKTALNNKLFRKAWVGKSSIRINSSLKWNVLTLVLYSVRYWSKGANRLSTRTGEYGSNFFRESTKKYNKGSVGKSNSCVPPLFLPQVTRSYEWVNIPPWHHPTFGNKSSFRLISIIFIWIITHITYLLLLDNFLHTHFNELKHQLGDVIS